MSGCNALGSLRLVSSQSVRQISRQLRIDRDQTQIFRLRLANEQAIKWVAMELRQCLQEPKVSRLDWKQDGSGFLSKGEQAIDRAARYAQLADRNLDRSFPD